jgi:acyl phosphate:glycerol-3-phosphate acyltransferase
MEYLLSSLIGYFLGSIPSAYLLLKKVKNIDITTEGTGNVGAMNAYEVSRSRLFGFLVLITDAVKGLLSVYIILLIMPYGFVYPALSLFFAVFGHCFNPWLKFKGGRGLAAAAGGAALLFPFVLLIWVIIWVIVYAMKKDIIFANVWATLMSLIIIYTSSGVAYKYSFPKADTVASLIIFSTAILMLIFIKHLEPLKEILENKKFFLRGKK